MSVTHQNGAVHPDVSFRDTVHGLESDAVDSSSPHEESNYTPPVPPPQTYPSCFGLPYQDHNYGAPPPPSPSPSPPPAVSNCNLDVKEEVVVTTGEAQTTPTQNAKEAEVDDSITRCICDYLHDDGYMICCDKCSVWQHIECLGIDKNSIPENYYCEECEPREVDRVRARQIQTRKREMYPHLYVYPTDSSATDTDPEEAQNRLLSHGNNASEQNKKAKQLKKRRPKDKVEGTKQKKVKKKDTSDKKEKENTSNEANRKQISVRSRREKVTNVSEPVVIQHEETQDAWDNSKSTWLDRFETARVNQYSADMQELLTSKRVNGHNNEIADQVTGGLRVQRCHVAEVKSNRQGLLASEVIEEGLAVIEYIGKVMLRQQYDTDNFFLKQLNPFVLFYSKLDGLDLCIDASSYGNDARYLRRSCQPSAEIRHVVANGQVHFFVVATKEITVNAEILIPFDYDYKQCSFCVECACQRNNCPVSRYHKRVLKLKSKNISTSPIKSDKSPVKSPVRSPLKSTSKSPTKLNIETSSDSSTTTAATSVTTMATTTMITRRSQVSRQNSISFKLQQVDVVSVDQEQANAEFSPVEPLQITNSAPSKYSAEEENSQTGEDSLTSSTEPKKKSREERKMEAIMRAFEKMEKRQERRKEALTRLEQSRRNSKDESDECRKENSQNSKLEQLQKVKSGKEGKVPKDSKKESKPVKQEEQSKPIPEVSEVTEETQMKVSEELTEGKEKQEVDVTEIKEEKVGEEEEAAAKEDLRELRPREIKSKGKKPKRTSARRRTRYSISCIDPEAIVSHDEGSNQGPLGVASCPVTPADAVNAPPSFKFLKTKRHLMNEWLSEKSQDGKPLPVKTEPLEVTVDESLFVPCLPSPRNSMERLRRNSQSQGCSHRPNPESSAGSAKKRWLRQAMGETPSPESGLCSPPAFPSHGGMSPNLLASTHSPGASPPADFVTPLKKRLLARESIDQPFQVISSPSISTVSSQSSSITSTDLNADSKLELEKNADSMRTYIMEGEAFVSQATEPYVSNGLEKDVCSAEKEISTSVGDDRFLVQQTADEIESEIIEPKSESKLPTSSDWDENPVVEGNNLISSDCYSIDNSNLLTTSEILSGRNGVMASSEKLSGLSEATASSGLSDPFVFVSSRISADCTVVSSRDTESDMEDSFNPSKDKVNSEPDSSECCVKEHELEKEGPVEMECDSVNLSNNNDDKLDVVHPRFSGEQHVHETMEVDSTQVDDKELRICNENNDQEPVSSICISSETRSDSVTQSDGYEIYSDNSHSLRNKMTCSSSSPEQFCSSSEVTDKLKADRDETLQDTSCIDKAQVDSSTDLQQETILQNCTESSASSDVTYSHISDSVVTSFDDKQEEYPVQITADCQSSLMPKDSSRIEATNDLVSSQCDTDSITGNECSSSSFSTASSLFIDSARQIEVTVDSTTSHSLPLSNTTSYISIQDSLHDGSNECESMDVSSASDSGLFVNSYLTGDGKLSPSKTPIEDQQPVSASDQGPSSSNSLQDESQNLPTKKKVSLQEYRKRIKEKPKEPSTAAPPPQVQLNGLPGSTSASGSNSSSSLSGSTSPPLKLDGLPTLPLFVPYTSRRTERKEFKSSSDLVSPIFHRRGKKEEPRKQMSLAERLKQEFGLDDTEEEENSNSDKTPEQAASSTTPSQSSLQTFQPLGLPHPLPQVPSQQIPQLGFHQPQGVASQLVSLACPSGPQHQLPVTATPQQQPPNGLGGSRIPSLMSIPTFPSQQLQAALGQTGQQNGTATSLVVDPTSKLPAAQPQINNFYPNLNGHVTGLPQNFPPVIPPAPNQQGISASSPHPLSHPAPQAALISAPPTQVPNTYSSINFGSLGSSGTVAGAFSGSGAVCAQQQVFDYSHRSVSSFGSVPNTKQSIPSHHHPHHVSQGDVGSRSQYSGYNNSSQSSHSYSSNQHHQTLSPSSSQRHPCRKKTKHKRQLSGGEAHNYS
ncbi:hypothetical protein CHS0354_030577 [Potamilus streckersoni]|uniref:Histone-lysine N-methyltransferase 2E n=1 Tax=Potamilus streckersoni TaxID=2493646 RepID=A0AAE0VTG8_9BIVA|nr:hypothetical protein CHS0354_030577 [Potamilus streckersoni]